MSGRRHRRPKLPTEPVTLSIAGLSHEGRGIAHVDGKVAFVEGALPGEKVTATYVRRRSQLDELRLHSVLVPAPDRVTPPCAFAHTCGGCSLQHMQSATQIALKQQVLCEQLAHATGLTTVDYMLLPPLQAGAWHYRRKARLAVRMVMKKGGALVGFREKYSSFITDMDNCQVLNAAVAALIAPLRTLISELQGSYTIPQIEVAVGERSPQAGAEDNDVVALVVRHLEALSAADREALCAFADCHGVQLYLQPGGAETVHRIHPLAGEERLAYHLPDFNLRMAFHPLDFTQINGEINRLIIHQALAHLELNPADRVLDLFCGLGNFTLPIATRCAQVTGVEGSDEMVARAAENARSNAITNARFFAANLCEPLAGQSWAREAFTKVLLDPPRSGAAEVMPHLASLKPRRIVYISCNPATLARDAAILVKAGYRLQAAGVMDMFPHTTHVESMAVFTTGNDAT